MSFVKIFPLLVISHSLSCVPVQQQKIDNQLEKLNNYTLYPLKIDPDVFQRVVDLNERDSVSLFDNDTLKIYPELMQRNFQSSFTLPGYGEIMGGELIRKENHQSSNHFKIIDDYLLFELSCGGVKESQFVQFDLIWNGKYYQTKKGLTVDLVLSFKDLDIHRALVHKRVGFDIVSIQTQDANELHINFLGYDQLITYQY